MLRSKPDDTFYRTIYLRTDAVEIYICGHLIERPGGVPDPVFGAEQAILFTSYCEKDYRATWAGRRLGKRFGESLRNTGNCRGAKRVVSCTRVDSTTIDSVSVI